MKKQIYKIIILIFITFLFLGASVNYTGAFLNGDLGLNLYKDLDKGLKDFEEKMYVYELNEQNKNNISTNINKILNNKDIGKCLVDGITPSIVDSISKGNIEVLLKNMKKECYNPKKKEYSNKNIGNLIYEIKNIKQYYLNKAEKKAKLIYDISRIGMYSDGNINNSPFDIINDMNKINSILFTEKIKYNDEDVSFLNNYQNKPLIGPLGFIGDSLNKKNNLLKQIKNNNLTNNNWGTNLKNNGSNKIKNNGSNKIKQNNNLNKINGNSLNVLNTPDGNKFLCYNYENQSGLNDDSLNGLIGSIKNYNGAGKTFTYGLGGHIKLSKTNKSNLSPNLSLSNKIIVPPSLLGTNYINNSLKLGITPYSKINDNKIWKCNDFICLKIDFIVKNQKLLDYSKSHSIQNILEISNKHLKKSANTSGTQSKMSTNNFEISLRDLDLSNMFHMGMNLSYKSPPILDLEKKNTDSYTKSKEDVKNMLFEKYRSLGLKYSESNNINIFRDNLKKVKIIISTAENPSKRAYILKKELDKLTVIRNKILNYNTEVIHKDINNNILRDFDKQFSEISQFNINLMNYVYSLDVLIKKLKEIPTYSG